MATAKKRPSVGQILGMLLGAAIVLLFSPLASFVFNSGSAAGMALGLLIFFLSLFFPRVKAQIARLCTQKRGKILLTVLSCLFVLLFIYISTVTVLVVRGFSASETIPANTPAIVLGCAVNGDKPSHMLQKRIDAAFIYLTENPQAVCILSGGKGDGESLAEAEAMYQSLVEKGIAPERLYKEDKSTTTAENMQYSKEILETQALGDTVVLITTDFHQFRAGLLAQKCGLSVYKVCAQSGTFSLPTFIVREWFTVIGYFFAKQA